MPPHDTIKIESLTAEAFAPYGWMLGKPFPVGDTVAAFASAGSDFWHEHLFDPGTGGESEVLWVTYRVSDPVVGRLEVHDLTQQAVVPLTGGIIQIVAASDGGGLPDLTTIRAFLLQPGIGICMRPGTWHATRTNGRDATCLMLTRRSTTLDLVDHLVRGKPGRESRLHDIANIQLTP